MGQELLHARYSPWYTVGLMLFLVLALLVDNTVFGPRIHGFLGNYLLPGLMWGLLILFLTKLPAVRPYGKIRHRRLLRWLALICLLIAVLIAMLGGVLGQFGKSPYDHSWTGIIINLLSLGVSVVALEISRSWLINRHFSHRPFLGILFIAPFFTLFSLSINQIIHLDGGLAVTKFVGMSLIPELGQNVLATYLAFLGGAFPAIIYRGGIMIIERLSPVLPNAGWAIQTLLGALAPILGLVLVRLVYKEENRETSITKPEDNAWEWLLTVFASIMIIWFCMGVFTYSPRVILSGSMQPGINIGDVVIIKEIDGKTAQIGDIIMFPLGEMKVTHRVIDVKEVNGKKYFTTKGDANNDPERDPVSEKNVKGKVVMVIPKAGQLTILMRSIV